MATIEDELTGLHNRRSFLALLRRHIGFANDRRTNLALIVVDIDGFARLNAAHGYEFGDQALQYVAKQLREVTRAQDYAARIGDNRFALILPGVMNAGHAELAVHAAELRLMNGDLLAKRLAPMLPAAELLLMSSRSAPSPAADEALWLPTPCTDGELIARVRQALVA